MFRIHLLVCSITIAVFSSTLLAQDWPAIRGPNGTGNLNTEQGVLRSADSFEFKTRWKKTLGSGYSSVVVANSKVVTMYTDGDDDRVICLNVADGETIWDVVIEPMFKGENGSFDGPISTPLIHADHVYLVTARGKLLCVKLANGETTWTYDIPERTGAKQPLYGFVTSPIVVNETLIVQAGGPDKAVVGLDPISGKEKWAVGNDVIDSQTPSTIQLTPNGKTIVLAAGGKNLLAVSPDDGTVLLEFKHDGGNGQAMTPVHLGEGKVLLTLDDRFSTTVNLSQQTDNQLHASPGWKERSIKNTYNIPVLCDGGVFAYSTRILTCVDPESGRAFWKTREPGDGFLITVDQHMVINTKKGSLHLAKASQDRFEEIASLQLFEDLVWSVPAYSDNSVFARSLGEIARVDIVPSNEAIVVADTRLPMGSEFANFIASVQAKDDPADMKKQIDEWMAKQKRFPIIEDGIAHFVYRGEQTDVALAGDFFGARQEKKMVRVDQTDLCYYTLKMPADQRVNYCFLIDFKPIVDPLNPRQMTSSMYAGEMEFAVRLRGQEPLKMSWLGMQDWKQPEYLNELENVSVQLESHEIALDDEGNTSEIDVLLPPGYKDSERAYPVAYIFDGQMARERGEMDKALTQHFSSHPNRAAIVVFLNGGGQAFTDQLVSKIVPFVDEKFSTLAQRESRLVYGCGFTATGALVSAATKNDVFANVASESPLAFADAERMILQSMAAVEKSTKVHLQWGRFDMYNPHENWDQRTSAETMFKAFSENSNIQLTGGQVNDSTDWSSWKNRYAEVFELLAHE